MLEDFKRKMKLNAQIRKAEFKFLAVGEACKAIFLPSAGRENL